MRNNPFTLDKLDAVIFAVRTAYLESDLFPNKKGAPTTAFTDELKTALSRICDVRAVDFQPDQGLVTLDVSSPGFTAEIKLWLYASKVKVVINSHKFEACQPSISQS